jgi:flagellar hook-length control protein FliK
VDNSLAAFFIPVFPPNGVAFGLPEGGVNRNNTSISGNIGVPGVNSSSFEQLLVKMKSQQNGNSNAQILSTGDSSILVALDSSSHKADISDILSQTVENPVQNNENNSISNSVAPLVSSQDPLSVNTDGEKITLPSQSSFVRGIPDGHKSGMQILSEGALLLPEKNSLIISLNMIQALADSGDIEALNGSEGGDYYIEVLGAPEQKGQTIVLPARIVNQKSNDEPPVSLIDGYIILDTQQFTQLLKTQLPNDAVNPYLLDKLIDQSLSSKTVADKNSFSNGNVLNQTNKYPSQAVLNEPLILSQEKSTASVNAVMKAIVNEYLKNRVPVNETIENVDQSVLLGTSVLEDKVWQAVLTFNKQTSSEVPDSVKINLEQPLFETNMSEFKESHSIEQELNISQIIQAVQKSVPEIQVGKIQYCDDEQYDLMVKTDELTAAMYNILNSFVSLQENKPVIDYNTPASSKLQSLTIYLKQGESGKQEEKINSAANNEKLVNNTNDLIQSFIQINTESTSPETDFSEKSIGSEEYVQTELSLNIILPAFNGKTENPDAITAQLSVSLNADAVVPDEKARIYKLLQQFNSILDNKPEKVLNTIKNEDILQSSALEKPTINDSTDISNQVPVEENSIPLIVRIKIAELYQQNNPIQNTNDIAGKSSDTFNVSTTEESNVLPIATQTAGIHLQSEGSLNESHNNVKSFTMDSEGSVIQITPATIIKSGDSIVVSINSPNIFKTDNPPETPNTVENASNTPYDTEKSYQIIINTSDVTGFIDNYISNEQTVKIPVDVQTENDAFTAELSIAFKDIKDIVSTIITEEKSLSSQSTNQFQEMNNFNNSTLRFDPDIQSDADKEQINTSIQIGTEKTLHSITETVLRDAAEAPIIFKVPLLVQNADANSPENSDSDNMLSVKRPVSNQKENENVPEKLTQQKSGLISQNQNVINTDAETPILQLPKQILVVLQSDFEEGSKVQGMFVVKRNDSDNQQNGLKPESAQIELSQSLKTQGASQGTDSIPFDTEFNRQGTSKHNGNGLLEKQSDSALEIGGKEFLSINKAFELKPEFTEKLSAERNAPVWHTEDLAENIVKQALVSVKRGISEIKVQLVPPQLGKMTVSLQMKDNQLSANIRVETVEARQLVSDNTQQLRESLADRGINVVKLDVFVQNSNQDQLNQSRWTGFERQSHNSYGADKLNENRYASAQQSEEIFDTTHRTFGYNTMEMVA